MLVPNYLNPRLQGPRMGYAVPNYLNPRLQGARARYAAGLARLGVWYDPTTWFQTGGNFCATAAALTPQFSNDDIANAFNWVAQAYQNANGEYVQMAQWLQGNAQSLSPDGLAQAQQALQQKSDAVNDLQEAVSKMQAIVTCIGITGANVNPGLSGTLSGMHKRGLGFWPIVAVVASVLLAAGIAIYYIKAKDDDANARFASAQNQTSVINTANTCLQTGQCTPAQYAQIIQAGALSQPCPDGQTRNAQGACTTAFGSLPWTTIALVVGGAVVVKSIFG